MHIFRVVVIEVGDGLLRVRAEDERMDVLPAELEDASAMLVTFLIDVVHVAGDDHRRERAVLRRELCQALEELRRSLGTRDLVARGSSGLRRRRRRR